MYIIRQTDRQTDRQLSYIKNSFNRRGCNQLVYKARVVPTKHVI